MLNAAVQFNICACACRDRSEVEDELNANGLSLSGGQQQRLSIARTVAVRLQVILLDEPVLGARSDLDCQD